MEEQTLSDFGEQLLVICGIDSFPDQHAVFRDALSIAQERPEYRSYIESVEVADYPEQLRLIDDKYGIKLLRPWL